MIDSSTLGLETAFGCGVAGNFAGHLEQAGEAADFVRVAPVTPEAPRAVFPWYVPSANGGTPEFLHVYPLASDTVTLPSGDALNLQIEPEAAMVADVVYDGDGRVRSLVPRYLGAFNDCSIRREGAVKISHKKNWGPASKGLATRLFAIDDLDVPGSTEHLRLASFLRRDGETFEYGIDSPVREYSYYGTRLIDWIVDRLREQTDSPDTPIENVGAYLDACGRPSCVVIGLGATRYTAVGESTYLRIGDESVVVLYDEREHSPDDVVAAVREGREREMARASVLGQRVVARGDGSPAD